MKPEELEQRVRQTRAKSRRVNKAASVPICRIRQQLLLGPGDYRERTRYSDDHSQKARNVGAERVHMGMRRSATLHDYSRLEEELRHCGAMLTIPPKLRQNIAKLFEFDDSANAGSEVMLSTAMVALTDYAAAWVMQDITMLIVSSLVDERPEKRNAARVEVRNLGMSKNGRIY